MNFTMHRQRVFTHILTVVFYIVVVANGQHGDPPVDAKISHGNGKENGAGNMENKANIPAPVQPKAVVSEGKQAMNERQKIVEENVPAIPKSGLNKNPAADVPKQDILQDINKVESDVRKAADTRPIHADDVAIAQDTKKVNMGQPPAMEHNVNANVPGAIPRSPKKSANNIAGQQGGKGPQGLDPEELAAHAIDPGQPPSGLISQNPACEYDIKKYCPDTNKESDVDMLVCLQEHTMDTEFLSSDCQHVIWFKKFALSQEDKFEQAAAQFCSVEIPRFTDCTKTENRVYSGFIISCLIEQHMEEIDATSNCGLFLKRMEFIMFSDWRLIGPFADACRTDIDKFTCGRTDINDVHKHTQGEVVECLLQKLIDSNGLYNKTDQAVDKSKKLADGCKHHLMRIVELQSDDFHLDRPLYYACRADRENLCPQVQSGDGKILACLIQQRLLNRVSVGCSERLLLREQLMARNYKASQPLITSCQQEIEYYKCTPPPPVTAEGQPVPQAQNPVYFTLTYVLLCLENVVRDHEVQWKAKHANTTKLPPRPDSLSSACTDQVTTHRRMLMSDYRIMPEVVLHCATEIQRFCQGQVQKDGATLHCLMGTMQKMHQEQTEGFGAQCQTALQDVVKMLTCLMNNLDSEQVTHECTARLMEIQYFLARDFTLDDTLFSACAKDAVDLCHATEQWWSPDRGQASAAGADMSGLVLPCLYRYAYSIGEAAEAQHGVERKLSPQCTNEVKRVMHERAISVRLLPQIEDQCLQELSAFCSGKIEPGDEVMCLQENYDNDKMGQNCRKAILEFTEMQSKDVKLNRLITKACRPAINAYCPAAKDAEIESIDVVSCLLEHKDKSDMTAKCLHYVQHYELITMKDYRFSHEFAKACKRDIEQNCGNVPKLQSLDRADIHTKGEIIRCLSQHMFEYRILGETSPLSITCSKQLRVEYLAVSAAEDPDIDPVMKSSCKDELESLCKGERDPLECLRSRKRKLGKACKAYIFKVEEVEFNENSFDYTLMRSCRSVINALCSQEDHDEVLPCLGAQMKHPSMTDECRRVVKRRMIEQASDIRLQPALLKKCNDEINRYCKEEIGIVKNQIRGHEADTDTNNNLVVSCLRRQFITVSETSLSNPCADVVKHLILDSEYDPRLDPPFYAACRNESHRLCPEPIFKGETHRSMLECVQAAYYQGKVIDAKCSAELSRRTKERAMDIEVDVSLADACRKDVARHCSGVKPGHSRVIQCLIEVSRKPSSGNDAPMRGSKFEDEADASLLTPSCYARLKERQTLWHRLYPAGKGGPPVPESLSDIVSVVHHSPAHNSALTFVALTIVCLFMFGLVCGRVTKRAQREMKMR